SDRTPTRRQGAPWPAIVVGAALALIFLGVRAWLVGAPRSPRVSDVSRVPSARVEPATTPNMPTPGGAGLFGQPLPSGTAESPSRNATADATDLPTRSDSAPRLPRRRRQDRHDARGADRHTIFSTDVATTYPTAN